MWGVGWIEVTVRMVHMSIPQKYLIRVAYVTIIICILMLDVFIHSKQSIDKEKLSKNYVKEIWGTSHYRF